MQLTEERLDKKEAFFKPLILYTLIFGITAVCVYIEFFYFKRTLLINTTGNIDGWAQHYPIYVEIKQWLNDLISEKGFYFWEWDIGLGEDVWMLLKGRILDPLTYIVIAFPVKYIDIGYSLMVIVRQYLTGVTFMAFGRYVNMNREQLLIGGLCYAFSGWAIISTITQGTFATALILFPLLVLGTDKMLKDHSPWIFTISVALLLIYSTIWAYVSAIVIFVYFILRYFHYRSFSIKDFLCHFASFIAFGVLGGMLSAFSFIQTFIKTTGATTESTVAYDTWYTWKEYLRMPADLFAYTNVHTSFSYIFLACTLMVFLPIAIMNLKKRSTAAIMMTLCLIAGLFPVTGSILNGFSYSVARWYFVVAFFMTWAMTECLTKETLSRKRNIIIMLLFIVAAFLWNILVCYEYLQIIGRHIALATIIGCTLGLLTIGFFAIRERIGAGKIWRGLCTTCIVAVMIVSITAAFNIKMSPGLGDDIYGYQKVGYTYENYEDTCQRIAGAVQDEDLSFFRSERIAETKVPPNKNMYHDMRSIYMYSSSIKKSWLEYNKIMGNNCGYFDRTTSFSNENRAGLDTLMGVKYYFIDITPGGRNEEEYVPYGYQYKGEIDGIGLYENQYSIGLGTAYDGFITESELMEYPYLEREQAMLQAAVVPDEYADRLDGIRHLNSGDIKTDVRQIEYEVTASEGIEMGKNEFTCTSESGEFTISIPEVENSEIIVTFDNLVRDTCSYDEFMELTGSSPAYKNSTVERLARQGFADDEKFKITVKKNGIKKIVSNRKGKNQGFDDVTDFNVNVGYFDKVDGDIVISFDNVGHYTYDALHVYAVPMDLYKKDASILSDNQLDIESFDHDTIKGSIDADKDSIVYMSILNTPGWSVSVDGSPQEKIDDVNISFTGFQVSKGSHEIVMNYESPGLRQGILISLAGLFIWICLGVGRRIRNRKQAKHINKF